MEKPKLKGEKVCYVGTDKSFFQNIIHRFHGTYPQKNWEFPIIAPKKGERFEFLFLKVLEEMPVILYIDFTLDIERAISLAENLSRDPKFKKVPLIGLVETKDETRKCLAAGVDFIYVKGGEFFDMVHSAMSMAFPKIVKKADFAKAKLSMEIDLYDDFRVGYIAPTYIHVEGNLDLKEGSEIYFNNSIPERNVPSKVFEVKNRSSSGLYYDFNYSYDLDFKFVDYPDEDVNDSELFTPEEVEGMEKEAIEKLRVQRLREAKEQQRNERAEFESKLNQAQSAHKDWVMDRMDDIAEKKTKLLIVDQQTRVYKALKEDSKPFSALPFSIRCQSSLGEDLAEIDKQRPAIIVYQLMSELKEEDDEIFNSAVQRMEYIEQEKGFTKNEDPEVEKRIGKLAEEIRDKENHEMSFVGHLIGHIKAIENYNPIVVLFRCYYKSSKALQESFQYPMIVTYPNNVSLDVCLNLAQIFEERQKDKFEKLIKEKVKQLKSKDPQKYRNLSESDFREKKYFIKKSNDLSYGSIKKQIVITNLSESEVSFRSDIELPMKTYRLEYPLAMSIHLIPVEAGKDFIKDKGEFLYKALIHSISERDKKNLRQQVNEVIFAPINEKRDKEMADFKELNDKVATDMEERKANLEKNQEAQAREDLGIDQGEMPPQESIAEETPNETSAEE